MRTMSDEELRQIRGSQDRHGLSGADGLAEPVDDDREQLAEVPVYHDGVSKEEALKRSRAMLASVRVPDPDRIMGSYPHQISGGQQQRVVIAMALLSNPKLLLARRADDGARRDGRSGHRRADQGDRRRSSAPP